MGTSIWNSLVHCYLKRQSADQLCIVESSLSATNLWGRLGVPPPPVANSPFATCVCSIVVSSRGTHPTVRYTICLLTSSVVSCLRRASPSLMVLMNVVSPFALPFTFSSIRELNSQYNFPSDSLPLLTLVWTQAVASRCIKGCLQTEECSFCFVSLRISWNRPCGPPALSERREIKTNYSSTQKYSMWAHLASFYRCWAPPAVDERSDLSAGVLHCHNWSVCIQTMCS